MYKVVSTDILKPVLPEEGILKEVGASLTYGHANTEDELIALTHDADAIINYLVKVTPRVINAMEHCKVIVRRGIGYDSVDVAAATAKGIPVVNVPDYCTDEVADHAIALMLSAARRIVTGNDQVRRGGWDYRELMPIPALRGAILGLLGFGKIPRAVAERAQSFGLQVITFDPFIKEEMVREHNARLVGLEELLKTADFISVHTPLTKDTRGMISRREFAMMKPSVVLVNTSRGPVIDEAALIEALSKKQIAFAGLDVLTDEPAPADSPLRKLSNAIVTPHIAWASEHSAQVLEEKVGQEIVRVFRGYFPKSLVNPEIIKMHPEMKREG